ncbi:acyltransferase [Bacteroides ovatus]
MNKVVYLIGQILSIVYPIRLESKLIKQLDKIYSYRIVRVFGHVGKGLFCERSIRLWNAEYIELGDCVHVFSRSVLAVHKKDADHHGVIKIGNNVTLGEYTHITSATSIFIGDNVLLGRRVTITDNSHGASNFTDMTIPPLQRILYPLKGVSIASNVWIGDNVVILPGVTIGEGSIIGANAVVTKDIPPYSVAVGNPARVVKSVMSREL